MSKRPGSAPPMDGGSAKRLADVIQAGVQPQPIRIMIPPTFIPSVMLAIGMDRCREVIGHQRRQMAAVEPILGLNNQQKLLIREGLAAIKRELELYNRTLDETIGKFGNDDNAPEGQDRQERQEDVQNRNQDNGLELEDLEELEDEPEEEENPEKNSEVE